MSREVRTHKTVERFTAHGKGMDELDLDNLAEREGARIISDLFKDSILNPENAENPNAKRAIMAFDLDGVVVKAAIGRVDPTETVESFARDHAEQVKQFQDHLSALRAAGVEVILNTARNRPFAKQIVEHMFGEQNVDGALLESGSIIWDHKTDTVDHPSYLTPELREKFREAYDGAKRHFQTLGWDLQEREYTLNMKPPVGIDQAAAQVQVKEYLNHYDLNDVMDMHPAALLINLVPHGVDKKYTLAEYTDGADVLAFGDSAGDHGAFETATIAVQPANASETTQDHAAASTVREDTNTRMAFVMGGDHLHGTVEALGRVRSIVELMRMGPVMDESTEKTDPVIER